MYTIGILERGTGLSAFLSANLPEALGEQVDLCPADSLPGDTPPDLLVISPDLRREEVQGLRRVCRVLLVPGRLAALAGETEAQWAVSYGLSPKDSLTLSSLEEETVCLALQREVVTLEGTCLEEQEFSLPRQGHASPCRLLACAGIQLLLGVPPGAVTMGRG